MNEELTNILDEDMGVGIIHSYTDINEAGVIISLNVKDISDDEVTDEDITKFEDNLNKLLTIQYYAKIENQIDDIIFILLQRKD